MVYLLALLTLAQADSLPTTMCRDYFFVPLTLPAQPDQPGERTLWFMYDTGASISVVDPDSVARVSNTAVSEGQSAVFRDLHSGAVPLPYLRARVMSLDHLSLALGRELDGILAFDAFGEALVTLDYQAGEVRLDAGHLPRPDRETVFRTAGPDKRPWLRVRFPGGAQRMLLDSGAAQAVLVVNDLERYATVAPPQVTGAVVGLRDLELRTSARAAGTVVLGGQSLSGPILQSTNDTELIGGAVMRHFTWTFEPDRKRVRIVPNTTEAISFDAVSATGMIMVPDRDAFRVARVLPGTPAEEAGVLEGDRVTHFDGQPLATRGCDAGGSPVTVTLERGGEPLEVVLVSQVRVE